MHASRSITFSIWAKLKIQRFRRRVSFKSGFVTKCSQIVSKKLSPKILHEWLYLRFNFCVQCLVKVTNILFTWTFNMVSLPWTFEIFDDSFSHFLETIGKTQNCMRGGMIYWPFLCDLAMQINHFDLGSTCSHVENGLQIFIQGTVDWYNAPVPISGLMNFK